jgi:hypothetical protein
MARAQRAAFTAVIAAAICLALLSPAGAVVPPIKQPSWVELPPQQQQILAPLAGEWDRLEAYRRKKWLGIAKRYSAMKPAEQQRVQTQMRQWVNLTPAQRMAAREKFKRLRDAPPEQRASVKQKWLEYKDLPDDEKQRLAEAAKKKPSPKSGNGKKSAVPVAASKRITAARAPAAASTTPAAGTAAPSAAPTTTPDPVPSPQSAAQSAPGSPR